MLEVAGQEEAIARRIEKNAEAERKRVVSEAKREAGRILKDARKGAKAEMKRMIEKKLRELEHQKESELAAVRAEAAKGLMGVRARLVDETFSLALERVLSLPREEHKKLLRTLILRGASSMEAGEVVVKAYNRDAAIFTPDYLAGIAKELEKRKVKARLKLSEERLDAPGIVLESRDGKAALDLRIEELFREAREGLSPEVEKILFRR